MADRPFRTELTNPDGFAMGEALSKAFGFSADTTIANRTNNTCWAWPSGSLKNNPGGSPLNYTLVEWQWDNGTLRVVVDRIEC